MNATDSAEKAPLPLAGIRVVEFTHMVMGPTCGMILADLGAEVIKVEPPGGERTRKVPGLGMGFFRSFNRNKKSVIIDLQDPAGVATAKALVATADVVLENFRPGLMASFGLDHDTLKAELPHLIYVSHKGFLPGPYENRLALDEVVQHMAGLTYMTGPPGRPLRVGSSVNDIMGGMFGAIGVLAALRERDRTGRGQEIQSALFENCCLLTAQHLQQFLMSGEAAPPLPSRVSAWGVYDIFDIADGEQLFVGAVSDKQFQALCRVLNRPDLAADPDFAGNSERVAHRPRLLETLGESLATRQVDELCHTLEAAGLPYAKVVRPEELVDDEHLRASGGLAPMTADDGSETQVVLLPLLMDGARLGVRHALPRAGEHNDEILGKLGRASDDA